MRSFRNFSRPLLFTVVVLPLWGGNAQAQRKTDVVILKNGDRITCEIKKLERGKLTASTDAMDTVEIEWDKVKEVTSNFVYQVELQSGMLFVGSVHPLPEKQRLVVARAGGTTALEYQRVVRMTPIEESFWQRIDGSVDLGYGYTQDQSATQWSLNAGATYTTRRYVTSADFSSLLKTQEKAEDVNRQDLTLSFNWLLKNRWFVTGLNQVQTNASLGLDLRVLAGGGIGRYLIQSNRLVLSAAVGGDITRERYEDGEPFNTNVEALAATRLEFFRFNHPEMDISSTFIVFPSLTEFGRVRLSLDGTLRFEVFKDFYWSLSVFESYDSDPPTTDFEQNDFGVTTSVGWSF